MNKHQIAYEYVSALKHQMVAEAALDSAFRGLGSDVSCLHVSSTIGTSYLRLVQSILGEHLTEWMDWWMWEADFGQRNLTFVIHQVTYDASTITFYKFLELVDER